MEKKIKRSKRKNRNIYFRFDKSKFAVSDALLFVLGSSFIANLFTNIFSEHCNIFLLVLVACAFCIYIGKCMSGNKSDICPYKPTQYFVGLLNVGSFGDDHKGPCGVLPRQKELLYLGQMLDSILAYNDSLKPSEDAESAEDEQRKENPESVNQGHSAIGIVGKSGSGKSVLLYLLSCQKGRDAVYHNLSYQYDVILREVDGIEWGDGKKHIIILDQFEQYFSLDKNQQEEVIQAIQRMNENKAAIIFALREEYLLSFLTNFNLQNPCEKQVFQGSGILSLLSLQNIGVNDDEGKLLFVSENGLADLDGENTAERYIRSSCNSVFKDSEIYNKFKNYTLIQKEIFLNLLQNEQHCEYETYKNAEENLLIKRFYDVQLSSTGNFFHASRIMYLLALGHTNNLFFKAYDLEMVLCISQIEKDEIEKCIKKLCDLQLIKTIQPISGDAKSNPYLDVSHDYIAQTFQAYASTEMDVDVRAALDELKTELVRKGNKKVEDICKIRKKRDDKYGIHVVLVLLVIGSISCFAAFHRTDSQLAYIKLVLSIFSYVYVFHMYRNIIRYFDKQGKFGVRFFYAACMVTGGLSIPFFDWWLCALGMGNLCMGISFFLAGCSKEMAENGRTLFSAYGKKTSFMGILLILFYFLLKAVEGTFWIIDISEMIEVLSIGFLIIYAFLTHLNKEHMFSFLGAVFSSNVDN